ncbi:MAG TPA: hypothetical protein V6C86_00875 [Oculatellaceae cyanobacterium]
MYQPTSWWLFLIIIFGYVALSLFIGGKRVFFEPFTEPPEEAENTPKTET